MCFDFFFLSSAILCIYTSEDVVGRTLLVPVVSREKRIGLSTVKKFSFPFSSFMINHGAETKNYSLFFGSQCTVFFLRKKLYLILQMVHRFSFSPSNSSTLPCRRIFQIIHLQLAHQILPTIIEPAGKLVPFSQPIVLSVLKIHNDGLLLFWMNFGFLIY